ncbi:xanthine dehydrogenase family protein molybdopterin-binding subunit [Humitalea sp. 24SJ18S-53]|uniref:xanthine dehydrogenase family protein molybdopterin-binding subunit n=1 Tax=Humitalea sp. 24SJ18S-53 TaxID=3422307 RepID=UPI003D6672AD
MDGQGIGASVLRKEDARHLAGQGRFVADIRIAGLREVAFLRSPLAHARITARTAPVGSDVLFLADLTGVKPIVTRSGIPGYKLSEWPVLADDRVRYVGEAIAMCVADSRAEAEDLVDTVFVSYEELPAIASCAAGRAPGAALLHPDWGDNLFLRSSVGKSVSVEAAHTIHLDLTCARQVMHPMEGKGLVARWDHRTAMLVVHTSTQVPHLIRTGLAEVLGIPQAMIRVAPPDVGGGFGYKCLLQPEEIAVCWLALTRKAAFRWTEDRREHLVAGANAREHHYTITAHTDARGKLLALDAEVEVDTGAYSVWPFTAVLEAAQAGGNLPGPYVVPAYRCEVYSVATNKPPFAPYRGVARPGVCFAIELTIDAIARAVGREAADVRAENLVPGSAMPYVNITNKHFDTGDYPASLAQARDMVGLDAFRAGSRRDEKGRYIGIGFATYTEQSAHGTKVFAAWGLPLVPGFDQASVKLTPDGALEVRAGIHTIGQGLETTLAQVAHTATGVPLEHIRVTLGDTGETPFSTGAYASRGIVMAGGAVARAGGVVAERIRAIAAHLLQTEPENVVARDGRLHAGAASIDFAEVGRAWYIRPDTLPEGVNTAGLEATEGYKPTTDNGVFSFATHAAKVAVDAETGRTEILDYVIVEDCGTMVNPMIVEGQTRGGAAQGIGTALLEECTYSDDAQPLASTLLDYLLPGATDVPAFRIAHTQTPSPHTTHGIKGVGEGGAIAPAGALVNAINDALGPLGAVVAAVPATPARVRAAIAAASA